MTNWCRNDCKKTLLHTTKVAKCTMILSLHSSNPFAVAISMLPFIGWRAWWKVGRILNLLLVDWLFLLQKILAWPIPMRCFWQTLALIHSRKLVGPKDALFWQK